MGRKVIVAGHICLDITPVFPSGKVGSITDILQPGKLIQMGSADVHTGGSVANTGLAMKKFGADVSLMGKIGNDAFGDMIHNILNEYGAGEGMIRSEEESTSYSVVLAIPGVDRIFLHNPGANNSFYAEDISEDKLAEADLFHFGYPPLMKSMYENDGKELVSMFRKVKAEGLTTSMDMAAVDPDTDAGRTDWNSILKKVIPYVDFFMPSVEELCYMLDRERFDEWKTRDGQSDITDIINVERDIKPLADICMEYGAKVLVIKCGASGMFFKSADSDRISEINVGLNTNQWAGIEGFERSYVPDRVLSATGAGDTSIAAFLYAMLQGYSFEKCMHYAAATGAACVASYDALSGLLSFDAMKERIDNGWRKRD